MFNIGPGELVVILILALILLGPDKLPEVARTIGKGMKELRRATDDIRQTVEHELYRADQEPAKPPPAVPPPLAALPAPAAVTPPAAVPEAVTTLAPDQTDLPPKA